MICEFGCKQEANFQLKNGSWCCCKSINSCLGMRLKNSKAKIGKNPFEGRQHPRPRLGKEPPNKGKTLEELYGTEKANELRKALSKKAFAQPVRKLTEDQKWALSAAAKKAKMGGYRKGSGRGKKGWYKGFWCDSTWELAFVVYNLDHGIAFKRNLEKFPYEYQGNSFFWYPDFILGSEYVEIKGFLDARAKAKISAFKLPLRVLAYEEMQVYLNYVVSKYGSDFEKLYGGVG